MYVICRLCKTDPGGVGSSMSGLLKTDPKGGGLSIAGLRCETDPKGIGLSISVLTLRCTQAHHDRDRVYSNLEVACAS